MSKTHEGYLLVADITGYTMYLSESELDHAQETLTTLLKLIIEHTRPPLVISRLEGDAVISYGLRNNFFQGQTFLEVIEDTYTAFRKTIERMVLNNTCRCNACANVASLDLKFFLHYGTFAIQEIDKHHELLGSDVNLIHRLLKNSVHERTGFQAYILCTDAAMEQLDLDGLQENMVSHTETYEHLGEVKVWVQDMVPAWEQKRSTSQVSIPLEQIMLRYEADFSPPPERLWDYLSQPEFRKTITGSDRQEITNRVNGRVAPGSIYQCYHGSKVIPETILEWQPFERTVSLVVVPVPIQNTTVVIEFRLVQVEGGTRLVKYVSRPAGPLLGRLMVNLMKPFFVWQTRKDTEAFQRQVEAQMRSV